MKKANLVNNVWCLTTEINKEKSYYYEKTTLID